jgi:hypothetical protein
MVLRLILYFWQKVRKMKRGLFLLFLLSQISLANPPVWGKTGHRVVGEVAEIHLSRRAKKMIHTILKGKSLAAVANFADDIKSDTLYRKYYPWHYVNYPADRKYGEVPPSPEGDIVMAIKYCLQKVKNPETSASEKEFFLKMLVHFVGDLHQPLHAGWAENRGGNDIQLQWFGNGSNLHRLWDSNLIDQNGMSYSELAENMPNISRKERMELQKGTVLDWVEESHILASQLYASVENGEKLGYEYSYKYWSTVEDQMFKGGVRLAAVLNDLFD